MDWCCVMCSVSIIIAGKDVRRKSCLEKQYNPLIVVYVDWMSIRFCYGRSNSINSAMTDTIRVPNSSSTQYLFIRMLVGFQAYWIGIDGNGFITTVFIELGQIIEYQKHYNFFNFALFLSVQRWIGVVLCVQCRLVSPDRTFEGSDGSKNSITYNPDRMVEMQPEFFWLDVIHFRKQPLIYQGNRYNHSKKLYM